MRRGWFIPVARGAETPPRVVAIDCDGETEESGDRPRIRRERLVRWAASGWDDGAKSTRQEWEGSGHSAREFWQRAEWLLKRGGRCWVVAMRATRVFGLLDLWRLVEEGKVQIGESTCADTAHSRQHPVVQELPATAITGVFASERFSAGDVPALRKASTADRRRERSQSPPVPAAATRIVIEDPPIIIDLRMPGLPGTLVVLDLSNWGLEEWPAELPLIERVRWLRAVLARMERIIRMEKWGSWRETAASQSMFTFRRAFMSAPVYCHRNAEVLDMERAAYVGGRCECRRIGKVEGRVWHVDFRSLYPSLCTMLALPTALGRVQEWTLPRLLFGVDHGDLLLAQVQVRTTQAALPARQAEAVIYPVGTWWTTLAGPELEYAVRAGIVRQVRRVVEYEGSAVLAPFMNAVLARTAKARQDGDVPMTQWLKRLANCLPGKFGQRIAPWEWAQHVQPPGPWCEWYSCAAGRDPVRWRSLGWQCQREGTPEWSAFACPAIAAWVTSAGRMMLWSAIQAARWQNVHYYDTDSLIVNQDGYCALCGAGWVRDGEPGFLRLVGRHEQCEIHGIKDYTLDGVRTQSGCPSGAGSAGPDSETYWYHAALRDAVHHGHRPMVEEILQRYARESAYRHGTVDAQGCVHPFRVEAE